MSETRRPRLLIANEGRDRLEQLARVAGTLGHEVIAPGIGLDEVEAMVARERPDVAMIGLGSSPDDALEVISGIVHQGACPVIALLAANDPAAIREAAKRGVYAYVIRDDPAELESAIEITVRRFAEYQNLQGAFGRRAVIEQAKGVLMGRHKINAEKAFEMLSEQSQHAGRKLADVAQAVIESHLLLAPPSPPEPPPEPRGRDS